MSYKIVKLLACSGLAAALTLSAFSQSASSIKSDRNAPTTSTSPLKRTLNDSAAAAAAAAAAPVTGTFIVKFTIKLTTAIPSGDSVYCALNASLVEENTSTFTINNEIEEAKSSKASVSGSTATCSTTIPYSWYLTNPGSDTVSLGYSVSYVGTSTTSITNNVRFSSQFVPGAGSIPVPPSGTTTTYTVNATL